jgi:hypothetical protein
MQLAHGIDVPLVINDIETLPEMVDIGFYDPDKKEWIEFEISRRKNDTDKFVRFYTSNKYMYLVGYNNIEFDQNVLHYILKHHDSWYDLKGEEIAALVYQFVQRHFDNRKYGIPARYKEYEFPIFPIDLFRINHFDNEAKYTSLKWCEFMMNMKVEECSVPFHKRNLTDEEMDEVISYRRHDVMATLGMLHITLGQPDRVMEVNGGIPVPHLSDYKGMNKLQDRFDVNSETGLKCLNWSDVKIGEEWNRLDYMKAMGITEEKHTFPTKVVYPYGKKFKQFFPKTMKFKTPALKEFIKDLGEQFVLAEKQEFPIVIGKTKYTIAKGGIHSTEKNRAIITPPGYIYRDADVGSQYPNSIVKLEIYAPHLKKLVLEQYKGKIELRITYKNQAKEFKSKNLTLEARKFESIQGLLKLCLNGGYYGKLGQKGSWLEFPDGLLKVCMGNQIEILMAIEAMEQEGFQVLSGNTDGFTTLFPADKVEKYKEICKWWEDTVGNHILGKLEYVDYLKMYQMNINHYIGQYIDEKGNIKVKKKGKFVTTFGSPGCELNKNKSERITPLALEAYFIDGKDPIEFIRNHKDINDFTIGLKAAGKMHYEEEWTDEAGKVQVNKHKKLVVIYISNKGKILMKRGLNNEGNPMNNHCFAIPKHSPELGQPLVTYFNDPFVCENFNDYDVNYNYYICETLRIIDDIEKTGKLKAFRKELLTKKTKVEQPTLF